MTTTKFHKTFGQVEVLSSDSTFTTIVIAETGEEKRLATKYAFLTDAPVTKVKKVKSIVRELTEEEKENSDLISKARKAMDNNHIAYDCVAHLGNENGFELVGFEGKEAWVKFSTLPYVNGFLAIPKSAF